MFISKCSLLFNERRMCYWVLSFHCADNHTGGATGTGRSYHLSKCAGGRPFSTLPSSTNTTLKNRGRGTPSGSQGRVRISVWCGAAYQPYQRATAPAPRRPVTPVLYCRVYVASQHALDAVYSANKCKTLRRWCRRREIGHLYRGSFQSQRQEKVTDSTGDSSSRIEFSDKYQADFFSLLLAISGHETMSVKSI